jgi:transcriptional regulator with XRE-family HTH domain
VRAVANDIGGLLREWRERRRLSQLALASEAGVSQRHVSFLESGRSVPSREMVLQLAIALDLPLRERNALLLAAGYAPRYPQPTFGAPAFAAARAILEKVVEGHLPNPALVVDRYWTLRLANAGARALLDGVAPHLLEGEVNVLVLSLHPDGLATRIRNLAEWRQHILQRLGHDISVSADARLSALRREIEALPYNPPRHSARHRSAPEWPIAVPQQIESNWGLLSLTCHGIFPPPATRVRAKEGTDDEANDTKRRTDHWHFAGA